MKRHMPQKGGPVSHYPKRTSADTGVIGKSQGSYPKSGIMVAGSSTMNFIGKKGYHHAVKSGARGMMTGDANHFSGLAGKLRQ